MTFSVNQELVVEVELDLYVKQVFLLFITKLENLYRLKYRRYY